MTKRYRSMDFLRMIAILLVILAHSILSYGAPAYLSPLQLGGTGVDLFFVLSGWLLGGQLFKEISQNGNVNIKRFWFRRWMRTLPAYYVVLSLSVLQRYLTKDNIDFPWQYFVFIQNYDFPLQFFSISWSLCVEEQFYLIIAPLLAVLALTSRKTTTFILLILLFMPVFFRLSGYYGSSEETHVRFDGCIAGVLLAQLHYQYQKLSLSLEKYIPLLAVIALMIYVFFYVSRYIPDLGFRDPDKLLLAFLFGTWVLLANLNDKWREKLYIPGANHIATCSYAMYLLHPEILALSKRFLIELPFVVYFLCVLIGTLFISEFLYQLIEKPSMDARQKFKASR